MSYRVTRDADERPRLVLKDEPSFCKALEAAPPAREPELDQSLWLIMVFPVWSMPDVAAIQTALDTAKHFAGVLQLGIRPSDSPDELATWCPRLDPVGSTPLWLLLQNGEIRMKRRGLVTSNTLVRAIEAARQK
jgi:hypothetical protein